MKATRTEGWASPGPVRLAPGPAGIFVAAAADSPTSGLRLFDVALDIHGVAVSVPHDIVSYEIRPLPFDAVGMDTGFSVLYTTGTPDYGLVLQHFVAVE